MNSSVILSTTSTTTTSIYIPNANVIYPKDVEAACLQPAVISVVIVTSIMIPIRLFAMINLFMKMTATQQKKILRERRTRRARSRLTYELLQTAE